MRRRQYLAAAAAAGLAGCTSGLREERPTRTAPGTATRPSTTERRCALETGDLPVESGQLRTALPRDHIPAIVEPTFGEDWSDLSVPEESLYDGEGPKLPKAAPVVGIEYAGGARAYPLRVLNWHEIVNDDLPEDGGSSDGEPGSAVGGPLLVTYCPLCGSALAFERTVAGEPAVFGVSGHLWCSNLVLYDRPTDSLWSQLHGVAIRGPRTGESLTFRPTTLTTMAEWRTAHPRTEVLLPPPRSNTVRGRDATFDYFTSKYPDSGDQIVGEGADSGRLHDRTLVIGVVVDGLARAYPYGTVKRRSVINDTVGDLPVVVARAPGGTMVAYVRRVAGEVLRFDAAGERHMRAGGSRWERTTGRAVDGQHEGRRLQDASRSPPMFWEAWSDFHPETTIYGRG